MKVLHSEWQKQFCIGFVKTVRYVPVCEIICRAEIIPCAGFCVNVKYSMRGFARSVIRVCGYSGGAGG
jgi:hypothetical protein